MGARSSSSKLNVTSDVHWGSNFTVSWAYLPIVDFGKAGSTEGRAELAPVVRDAMRTVGFMCIVNHGLTRDEVFACCLLLFSDLTTVLLWRRNACLTSAT